jgi:hypothetical protein
MDKKQWQDLYNQLDQIYTDFHLAYNLYQNGSNKQKRKECELKVGSAIHQAVYYINQYPEAVKLLTEGNPFAYDEFLIPRYFARDLPDFLLKMKKKIDNND